MSASKKCSLILMSDDGKVCRLRVRAAFLRLAAAVWVLLVLSGGAGIWIGWKAWEYRRIWENDRYRLERELAENRVHLERLSNMEALYESSRTAAVSGGADIAPSAGPSSVTSPQDAAPSVDGTPPSRASADVVEPGGTTEPPAGEPSAPPAAPEEQTGIDTGVVRVENVSARLDDRRLRVSVDLYNGESAGQQISGRAAVTLLDADGQEYPLASDDMVFRIVRFKKLVSSHSLPSTLSGVANAAIRVEVFVNDKLEFRRIYPVEAR